MKLKLIVAMCKGMGIGYKNTIVWNIKKDLIYFSNKTGGLYGKYIKDKDKDREKYKYKNVKKNAIVMGKNTWMSLPKYPEPLPHRDNIIISNTINTLQVDNKLVNLYDMDNIESLAAIKLYYDLMYYINLEENYCESNMNKGLINKTDFNMYFSSISKMLDFCMSPEKICTDIDPVDRDDPKGRSNIEIEMCEMHEMRQMREINRNSVFNNENIKSEKFKKYCGMCDETIYDEVWIIGGAQIYNSFIYENNNKDSNIIISEFCITYIDRYYECDTFFPKIENMNHYYISSFLKCENMDANIGMIVPVYYITFNLIDERDNIDIQKKIVEIKNNNDSIKYYYYIKNDMHSDCENMYITNENAETFIWCITQLSGENSFRSA
jgi:dihydrofolate reductase